jgi:hypothetical protein
VTGVEILRQAAAKLRADHSAIGGSTRWHVAECVGGNQSERRTLGMYSLIHDGTTEVAIVRGFSSDREIVANFIASWPPALVPLLADWLDYTADRHEDHSIGLALVGKAVDFARAYLGEQP